MDKYREYLPQSWLEFIDRDPVLAAAFPRTNTPATPSRWLPSCSRI